MVVLLGGGTNTKRPNIIQILPFDVRHLFVNFYQHLGLVAMKAFVLAMELDTIDVWLVLNSLFCTVVPSFEIIHI